LGKQREFNLEPALDFEDLNIENKGIDSIQKAMDLYNDFKDNLLNGSSLSKVESQCKKEVLEGQYHKVRKSLPKRIEKYKSKSDIYLQNEEKFTNDLINTYTAMNK